MNALKLTLVSDWRAAWRWSSVRLHALMLVWVAIYAIAPTLPQEVQDAIPSPFKSYILAAYAILGIAARLTAKPGGVS